MLGCQVLFGQERGQQIQAMIEEATAAPCPCTQGRTCPLIPLLQRSAEHDGVDPDALLVESA